MHGRFKEGQYVRVTRRRIVGGTGGWTWVGRLCYVGEHAFCVATAEGKRWAAWRPGPMYAQHVEQLQEVAA